jgi:hypothetical protein
MLAAGAAQAMHQHGQELAPPGPQKIILHICLWESRIQIGPPPSPPGATTADIALTGPRASRCRGFSGGAASSVFVGFKHASAQPNDVVSDLHSVARMPDGAHVSLPGRHKISVLHLRRSP